ncbi:hypothetical protein ACS0TY_002981 [Phlomoides rotata]
MEDQGALHYQRDQLQGMNSMITKSASPKVIIFHQPPRPSQPFATLQDQFQAVKKLLQFGEWSPKVSGLRRWVVVGNRDGVVVQFKILGSKNWGKWMKGHLKLKGI